MAKKRKASTHRRRRVSGTGGNTSMMTIIGGVIGYVAGNTIGNQVKIDDKIKAAALIAIPILFGKKLKGPLFQGAGIGVAIAGAKTAGRAFNIPILAGMPVVAGYRKRVNGYGYPVVAGSADQPYLRTGAVRQNVVNGVTNGQKVYAGSMMDSYNDK